MNIRCPACHASYDLIVALEVQASTEMARRFHKAPISLARPLVAYLSFFKPRTRSLSNDKTLRLWDEVLALCSDEMQLSTALQKAVEALREKQSQGTFKQLKNHAYLQRVLEDVPETITALEPVSGQGPDGVPPQKKPEFKSKTGQAMAALQRMKRR